MVLASEKRILVVDDEPDVRDFLCTCLEDAGFQVEVAVDGYEALNKIEQHPPDLITLDLVMPRISGIKMMRKLRRDARWQQIPIIIVTAHARDELGQDDVKELYAEEVQLAPKHILEKPITPSKLVMAIAEILSVELDLEGAGDRADVINLIKSASPEKLKEIREMLR
jgi:CheY-like chemotaxis protein